MNSNYDGGHDIYVKAICPECTQTKDKLNARIGKKDLKVVARVSGINDSQLNASSCKTSPFESNQQEDIILMVRCRRTAILVKARQITHVSCLGYKLKIFIEGSAPIATSDKFKELVVKLYPAGFFRTNHNTLVNLRHVKSINLVSKQVILQNGTEISVSRRKWVKFRDELTKIII